MLLNPTRLQQDTCILIGCCRFRLNDTFLVLWLHSLTNIESEYATTVVTLDTHIVATGIKDQGNQLRFGNLYIILRKQNIGNEILRTEYLGKRCTEIVVSFVGHVCRTNDAVRLFALNIRQLESIEFGFGEQQSYRLDRLLHILSTPNHVLCFFP